MTLKGLIIVAAVMLLAGCASSGNLSREMASLQNGSVASVVAVWGEPDSQKPYGKETVLTWYDRAPADFGVATSVVVCERMLAVTSKGTITGWRWRGDRCNKVSEGMRARGLSASR